jgi:hypothetical protein
MVRRSWQKHGLTILMVFDHSLVILEANNGTEAFPTNCRTRSMGNLLQLRRGCPGAKVARQNSTARREL